ncbi:MAG: TRAP transporter large permease [Atribacterota bacterium]|jgi:tripartite ATP-independent transporter DctM subunit|nr:TRAP transporter large permease [Atribacterota bacterium]MDD5637735.1 TRAP transporter large permease [Atribacterota bacterium]
MFLAIWVILFIIMFLFGYPIIFAISIPSILYIILTKIHLAVIVDTMVIGFEKQFVLLSVPLFILAAKIMNESLITERLFNFAGKLVGSLKGGLGHVNVLVSVIFAGMTGSAIADASGLGLIEIKAMNDAGFDPEFSCAVTSASSTIGPIIPPSIPMVIYSMISGASVGHLFIGGVIPGVFLALAMMIYVAYISKKRDYPADESFNIKSLVKSFLKAFFPLLTPVILLGGIYGGVFTPTEAAAVAVFYAFILSVVVYRILGWKKLIRIFKESALSTGQVSAMVAAALIFSYIVSREQIPVAITNAVMNSGIITNKYTFLLFINLFLLLLGCFMDPIVGQLIVMPILIPIAILFEIDLVHLGVISTLNFMIGLSTPPYGESLFIVSAISGTPLGGIIREMWPFIGVLVAVLLTCTYLPELVLFLPKLAGYIP